MAYRWINDMAELIQSDPVDIWGNRDFVWNCYNPRNWSQCLGIILGKLLNLFHFLRPGLLLLKDLVQCSDAIGVGQGPWDDGYHWIQHIFKISKMINYSLFRLTINCWHWMLLEARHGTGTGWALIGWFFAGVAICIGCHLTGDRARFFFWFRAGIRLCIVKDQSFWYLRHLRRGAGICRA